MKKLNYFFIVAGICAFIVPTSAQNDRYDRERVEINTITSVNPTTAQCDYLINAVNSHLASMKTDLDAIDTNFFDLTAISDQLLSSTIPSGDMDSLGALIKEIEAQQEEIRRSLLESRTMFENFDPKLIQLYNILSTVMKALNEIRTATVRNMM